MTERHGIRVESAWNPNGIRTESESLARGRALRYGTVRNGTALQVCRSQVQNGSVVDALANRRIGLGS